MNKKVIIIVSLIIVVVAYGIISFVTPYSSSKKLEEGELVWEGGINGKHIYSSLTDLSDDDIAWKGRVWVENSMWQHNYSESITKGVGKKGKVQVTINKSWLPGMINKSGYKDIVSVDEYQGEYVE